MRLVLPAIFLLALGCGGPPSVPQDLTLSGPADAHITSATVAGACQVAGGTFAAQLLGDAGGPAFTLYIEIRTWHGAGTYKATVTDRYGATFPTVSVGWKTVSYTSRHGVGTLEVAADNKHGTVDMALTENGAADGAPAHLSGSWRCT